MYALRIAVLVIVLVTLAYSVGAAPIAVAEGGSSRITLHSADEVCQLKAVKNLPGHAIIDSKGKTLKACYGEEFGNILFFVEGGTVEQLPAMMFKPVTSF